MVTYLFNDKTQILETLFEGDIFLNEITDFIIETRVQPTFPRTLKILVDAQNISLMFTAEDLGLIADETNESLKHYDSIVSAMLVDSPEVAALSTIYQDILNNNQFHFNIFSTKEAALSWLEGF